MASFIAATQPNFTTLQDPTVATLPTGWAAGDLVLVGLYGKYGAPTVTTPSGWTLIQAHTGGTVTTGNDAGNSFMNVYGRIMQAGDTDPSFDYTGTLPNSNGYVALCYRPDGGNRWTDFANLANIPKITVNDTTAASPLTGSATFGTQPSAASGDTLVAFGAVPSDLSSAVSSPAITATGISGGTTSARAYAENTVGADSAGGAADRMGWTGTATSATTLSMTFTSVANMYGPMVGLWLREELIPPTSTAVARVSLAPAAAPDVDTGHSIKIRARKTSGTTVTVKAALYESTNNRSGDLESSPLTTSFVTYSLPISSGNAANITSYNDLEIRFWGYSASGDTGALVEVADIWLETPEPASTPISGSETHTLGESAAVAVTIFVTGSETHTQSEGTTVLERQSSVTESFSFVDAASVNANFTARTDSNTMTEGASSIADTTGKSATDSATQTEGTTSLQVQEGKAASDSIALSETLTLLATLSLSESHTQNEGTTSINATAAGSDSATQDEGETDKQTVDAKAGSDSFALNAESSNVVTTDPKAGSDSATQTEAASSITATASGSDSFTVDDVGTEGDALGSGTVLGSWTLGSGAAAHVLGTFTARTDSLTLSDAGSVSADTFKDANDALVMNEALVLSAAVAATEAHAMTVEAAEVMATFTRSDSSLVTELASSAATDFKVATDAATQNEGTAVLTQTALKEASDSFAQSEVTASIAAAISASDAVTLNEVAIAAAIQFLAANDSLVFTDSASKSEQSGPAAYIHHLPPMHGDTDDYDLSGIVFDAVSQGIQPNHVALGVVTDAIAAGLVAQAEAQGTVLDATTSGEAEHHADGVNV